MQVLSSLSSIPFYAPSAGFAPTNSADVSAIASAYQVVSATATQLNAGTAYLTSVNEAPISAARAGQAANASMANSAYYDGTGRLISALPDSAEVSAIASSYAESAASSKLDESATANFYPTSNPSGFISGVDLSDYATTADLANKLDTTAQVVTAVSTATSDVGGDTYTWVLGINGTSISAMTADVAGFANMATYDNEGRKLTALAASSSLANYQTTAKMSGYLPFSSIHADANSAITSINGSSIGGGGGMVTALGTGTDPWYQTSISSINGMNLSAKWADSASKATDAKEAMSANYAKSADYAKTVAPSAISAYISAVTSPSGTIIVTNRTGIDVTDSAVVGEYVPGYSGISTYAGNLVPFNGVGSAIFTGIPDSLPVALSLAMRYGSPDTVTFSGSNGTTASASYAGSPTALTAGLGTVSSVYIYTQNAYLEQDGLTYTADAVDNASIVALAHASALPTYQYDAEDKISSINGSALAGGMDSATCSAIASAYAESAVSSVSGNYYTTANESGFLTAQAQASWSESASASPSYIQDKPDLVDIVAGPGIVVDNPDGNTLRVSQQYPTDETVLFTATNNNDTTLWSSKSLSETISNFERIRITWERFAPSTGWTLMNKTVEYYTTDINNRDMLEAVDATQDSAETMYRYFTRFNINGSTYSESKGKLYTYASTANNWSTTNCWCHPIRIVGIHRIAGGN